jgi:hypothetical protein
MIAKSNICKAFDKRKAKEERQRMSKRKAPCPSSSDEQGAFLFYR